MSKTPDDVKQSNLEIKRNVGHIKKLIGKEKLLLFNICEDCYGKGYHQIRYKAIDENYLFTEVCLNCFGSGIKFNSKRLKNEI